MEPGTTAPESIYCQLKLLFFSFYCVYGLSKIKGWILSSGDKSQVLKPHILREKWRQLPKK